MQGKIIKGIAGFYYIYAENDEIYECKAKGIFRNRKIKPLVGDNVDIAILDADKEGFLRSRRSLIQIIGRAARNAKGKVIMYADKITESMQEAIDETARRRSIQMEYNEKHGIVPKTIIKPIHDVVRSKETKEMAAKYLKKKKLPAKQKEKMIKELEQEMKEAARTLDFERAAQLRDILFEMKGEK